MVASKILAEFCSVVLLFQDVFCFCRYGLDDLIRNLLDQPFDKFLKNMTCFTHDLPRCSSSKKFELI